MHEYTVLGHPRERVILIIAVISMGISHFIASYVQPWLSNIMDVQFTFALSSFTVFSFIYLLFNLFVWKFSLFEKLFRFPNLSGEWECKGISNNLIQNKQYHWEGTVVITQTWDKILITIKTANSTSQSLSITSGIKHYPGVGYKVTYHYENTPNVSADGELKKHEGFCILTFDETKASAEGCYFNNIKDRASYGEMKLKRR